MNQITRTPIRNLGYDFIPPAYLPDGKDEYYLRNLQNPDNGRYRNLTLDEVESLKTNGNNADDWSLLLVTDEFLPELIHRCNFFGLVRIGKLEPFYLEFHNLRRPVGLYNSTIISSDIGSNVVIDNVNYLSHYIVGNDCILINVSEIATTDHAKFGNGIIKEGEPESIRILLEVCNENGGRSIIPFDGMLPGDAWLFSRFREDDLLQDKLKAFTDGLEDHQRGYYGTIGERTVIKNCKIIKDVRIGTDAYLKGANKLKNLTIHSSAKSKTQIGEGCELVNGIIGYGCRIFYGVKAVRFILASNSQLKYGARLINSYLGNNSTISCCEVLNSLIFPAHEQHHNNSFLCASLLMGQTNMAAGATIGSNHNSRGADGELIAGRGFWPGLCVSVKHNSRFASFVILTKGDYPAELDISLPFSLVSNDVHHDELLVMPAYWFMHNLYALARNSWKYSDRDKRTEKSQFLEYDYLAPDSLEEILGGIETLELAAARSWRIHQSKKNFKTDPGAEPERSVLLQEGRALLEKNDHEFQSIPLFVKGFENSIRPTRILKGVRSYAIYRELVVHYATEQALRHIELGGFSSLKKFQQSLPEVKKPESWVNMGGQLVPGKALKQLISDIHNGRVNSWDDIHSFYLSQSSTYADQKRAHAFDCLHAVHGLDIRSLDPKGFSALLRRSLATQEWIAEGIMNSRKKDYVNPFRKMVYENQEEMDVVVGRLEDNGFIQSQNKALESYRQHIEEMISKWA